MIVRPSQRNYQEYLTTCLHDKVSLFRTAWAQHLSELAGGAGGSAKENPTIPQARDLYSKILGFEHWHQLINCLQNDEAPWDDPRFQYLDMSPDLMTHLDRRFMATLQLQRVRLYQILQKEPLTPKDFFSVCEVDHGPVESALLMMHRIPSPALSTHLKILFTLNKRRAVLSDAVDERRHMMIKVPEDGSFGISDILSTCQVPAMVFGSRKTLTPSVARRFLRKDISLANPQRNPSSTGTWTVNDHLSYLASIMVDPYPKDSLRENIETFLYFMVNWMIHESPNGRIHLDYPSLSTATDLHHYHIDALSSGRNGYDLNTLSVAMTPSIFLRETAQERFKSLVKRLVYGSELGAEEHAEYEQLFQRAVSLSRPARGLMLMDLSEHLPVLMPDHLHHPHSDIVFFDHSDVIKASHWYSRQLHVDGMKHIVEELESISFGGALFTCLPDADNLDESDIESLRYLMESCDKRRLQLVMLTNRVIDLPDFSQYCSNFEITNKNKELMIRKVP